MKKILKKKQLLYIGKQSMLYIHVQEVYVLLMVISFSHNVSRNVLMLSLILFEVFFRCSNFLNQETPPPVVLQ